MSLFHGYNEISKPNMAMSVSSKSPFKTTVFKPKELGQRSKGLSMRSYSDMNVFHSTLPTSVKESTYNSKELKISKPGMLKPYNSEHKTYLSKEQWKYSNCEYQIAEFEGLSLKEEKGEIGKNKKKTEEVLDDKIFKKPLLPKRLIKRVREPENLAHFYDAQYKFDHEHIENIDRGFMDQLLKKKENIIPCEERDLEMLLPVEIPKLILPSSFDEEYIGLSSPELPYISDDDIFR